MKHQPRTKSHPSELPGRSPGSGRLLVVAALLGATAWGCGPAPGYVEEPESPRPESPSLQPEDVNTACRQAPAQQRMQGRMSRYSSIEGMGTLACPPTPLGPTGK